MCGRSGVRTQPRVETSQAVSRRMSLQRSTDTAIEVAVRRLLHKDGLRYRLHVRPVPTLRRTADVVFRHARVAVFMDGCFWHGCPDHGSIPKSNTAFWRGKILGNVERDADTRRRLEEAGWMVVRVWEHDDPAVAAATISALVNRRRAR